MKPFTREPLLKLQLADRTHDTHRKGATAVKGECNGGLARFFGIFCRVDRAAELDTAQTRRAHVSGAETAPVGARARHGRRAMTQGYRPDEGEMPTG
jgi:hypothetical protein